MNTNEIKLTKEQEAALRYLARHKRIEMWEHRINNEYMELDDLGLCDIAYINHDDCKCEILILDEGIRAVVNLNQEPTN
jgi:hypothetical protein